MQIRESVGRINPFLPNVPFDSPNGNLGKKRVKLVFHRTKNEVFH